MNRKWSVPIAVVMPVLLAFLLVLLAIREESECATGYREYSLEIGLSEEQQFTLTETGQSATAFSIKGCVPDTPEVTDEVVDQAFQDAASMTVAYSQQVRQFSTKEDTLFFFADGFAVFIKQKYRLFYLTSDTALEFELKTQATPTPTIQGRTA